MRVYTYDLTELPTSCGRCGSPMLITYTVGDVAPPLRPWCYGGCPQDPLPPLRIEDQQASATISCSLQLSSDPSGAAPGCGGGAAGDVQAAGGLGQAEGGGSG